MEVDARIQAGLFRDANHKYGETHVLQGAAYKADSKKYYEIMKPLLVQISTWTFIHRLDKTSNEWGSILTRIIHIEGDFSRKSCSSASYHDILTARYRGPYQSFTLNNYIDKYADAHAKLLNLKEALSKSKK